MRKNTKAIIDKGPQKVRLKEVEKLLTLYGEIAKDSEILFSVNKNRKFGRPQKTK